jgi:PIN domain nuclease of toxin-antitoxin system
LSKEALCILKKPDTGRELSTLSLTEIAIKVLYRKLDLAKEQIRQKIEAAQVDVLAYQTAHAYAFYDLGATA